MAHDEVTIRSFDSRADYAACVRLQREVWGEHFGDVVPPTILLVSQRLGGVAAGAFDAGGRLLGFVFGVTGIRDGEPLHWSDMLAVRPEARGMGLGRRLKLFQREQLLERGVRRMHWTYDPLVARNANLNLNSLGAVPVEYVVNLYGDTGSSLHAGLDTDRFIVEWRLDDEAPARGRTPGDPASVAAADGSLPHSCAPPANVVSPPIIDVEWAAGQRPLLGEPCVRVAAPADIDALKAIDPSRARAWQRMQRLAFTHYLGRGYRVSGFEHHAPPADSYYVVAKTSGAVRSASVRTPPAPAVPDR
ncbi:MAG: GNAT family N-acetyltransferase [Acidobacteria bacterium]|nr:GNAT family N-acetyltransferase [Acidobacteriota bacterium]